MNQSFYVNQNDPLTKKSGQIKFGSGLRLPHDRPGLQRVTTKNPKKVEAGKRLAESNRKKREAKKREEQVKLEASRVNQYYGIGAVLALGVIGGLGYYIYRTKKGEQPQQNNPKPHPQMQPQTNKFEMD